MQSLQLACSWCCYTRRLREFVSDFQIWATGDPSAADEIMADNVRFVDLLFEHETSGREGFKDMIHKVFKVSSLQQYTCLCAPVPVEVR